MYCSRINIHYKVFLSIWSPLVDFVKILQRVCGRGLDCGRLGLPVGRANLITKESCISMVIREESFQMYPHLSMFLDELESLDEA